MENGVGVIKVIPVKTAVIGASGFIGRHLFSTFRTHYADVLGTSFSNTSPELTFFDITRPDIANLRLKEQGFESVLIASAKPNVSFCEQNPEASYEVNVQGTLELVRQLGQTGLQTVFLSTDYVFDGTTGNYGDESQTSPKTEYGRQKALVEEKIPSLAQNYLILRLGKTYGIKRGDGTLLDEIASSLARGKTIRAAIDQIFCPTHIDDLVAMVIYAQSFGRAGIYNMCNTEVWSRYDIAVAVARAMKADVDLIEPISLHDLPSMRERPLNTSLRRSMLFDEMRHDFHSLEASIERVSSNWATLHSK